MPSISKLNHDECVCARVHAKRHAPLCPLRRQWKWVSSEDRMHKREDGRATGRVPGWKRAPEVASQPAFKSTPLGLTKPMMIHSVSSSVLLPTLSLGTSINFLLKKKGEDETGVTKAGIKLKVKQGKSAFFSAENMRKHLYLHILLPPAFCK